MEEVARELVEIASLVAARSPKSDYEADKKRVDKSLAIINKSIDKIKKKYEKQLKEKPESWQGVGRGSELEDLAAKLEDAARLASMMGK